MDDNQAGAVHANSPSPRVVGIRDPKHYTDLATSQKSNSMQQSNLIVLAIRKDDHPEGPLRLTHEFSTLDTSSFRRMSSAV